MKVLLENVDENREQWLKLKQPSIGSSEIATVCLMNPWSTPFELWAQKTGKIPPTVENDAMWLGTQLEPTVGRMFTRRTKLKTTAAKCLLQHETVPWALASPDFWVDLAETRSILEAKFTTGRNWRFWEDGPPAHYMIQTNWQLAIAEMSIGFLARLIGGDADDFGYHEFNYDAPLFEFCMERATEFEKCLREDIPPLAGEGDSRLIAKLQGPRQERQEVLTDAAILDADCYELLGEEISTFTGLIEKKKKQRDLHKGRLLQLIGTAKEGLLPDGRIVGTKLVERKGYEVQPTSWTEIKINKPKGR